MGVGADRALDTILGGKPSPDESEQQTPEQVRERITAVLARGGSPQGYGDCADMVAGMVLAFYEKRPEARDWPTEPKGEFVGPDGAPFNTNVHPWPEGYEFRQSGPDLYKEVKAFSDGKLGDLGITGLQWGWAVNAARYASSLNPQPNPAIVTVGR